MSKPRPDNVYEFFLKIPPSAILPGETAPDHYTLLGLPRFSNDKSELKQASLARNTDLRGWQNSDYYLWSNELLGEVVDAILVLESPVSKAEYDRHLRSLLKLPEPTPAKAGAAPTTPAVKSSPEAAAVPDSGGSPDDLDEDEWAELLEQAEARRAKRAKHKQAAARAKAEAEQASQRRSLLVRSAVGSATVVALSLVVWLIGSAWSARRGAASKPDDVSAAVAPVADPTTPQPVLDYEAYTLKRPPQNSVATPPDSLKSEGTRFSQDALRKVASADGDGLGRLRGGAHMFLFKPGGALTITWIGHCGSVNGDNDSSNEVQFQYWNGGKYQLLKPDSTTSRPIGKELLSEYTLTLPADQRGQRCFIVSAYKARLAEPGVPNFHQIFSELFDAKTVPVEKPNSTRPSTLPKTTPSTAPPKPATAPTLSELRLLPIAGISVAAGQPTTVTVQVDRGSLSGPVTVEARVLPTGITARSIVIAADQDRGQLELSVSDTIADMGGFLVLGAKLGTNQASLGVPIKLSSGEIRSFEGHKGTVYSVALSGDGRRAVTGGEDGTIRVWDVETGSPLQQMKVQTQAAWSVAISADGKRILSRDGNIAFQTLQLWDAETGIEERRLTGFDGNITSNAALSLDGKLALAATSGENLCLWDATTGELLKKLEGHTQTITCVALSVDGSIAVSGGQDYTLRIWDTKAGREQRKIDQNVGQPTTVFLSHDGKLAISGHDYGATLWDAMSGKRLGVFNKGGDQLRCAVLSSDGRRVVSGVYPGGLTGQTVRLWDVTSGKELKHFRGHESNVYGVAITSDGRRALSGGADGMVRLWQLPPDDAGQPVASGNSISVTSSVTKSASPPSSKPVLRLLPIPVVNMVAGERKLIEVRVERQNCTGRVTVVGVAGGGWASIQSVTIPADRDTGYLEVVTDSLSPFTEQRLTVTATLDKLKSTQNVAVKGRSSELRRMDASSSVFSLAFSPDGTRAVSGGQFIEVWALETGKKLKSLADGSRISLDCKVAFSADGSQVLAAVDDDTSRLRLWDVATGRALPVPQGCLGAVILARDGRFALSDASVTGSYKLSCWDIKRSKGPLFFRGRDGEVQSMALSGNDKIAITVSKTSSGRLIVQLWDAEQRTDLSTKMDYDRDWNLKTLALSEDGGQAVIGYTGGEILLLETRTGLVKRRFTDHNALVTALAVSPSGQRVLSGSKDGLLRLLELTTGRELWRVQGPVDDMPCVVFSPDGRRALSCSSHQIFCLWQLPDEAVVPSITTPPKPNVASTSPAPSASQPKVAAGAKELASPSTGMKLALIPAGAFQMGSPRSEKDRSNSEGPQHEVQISKPFYLGVYEVTQAEFQQVVGRNPSLFATVANQKTERFPVERVSWFDAVEFCNKLSALDELTPQYELTEIKQQADGSISSAVVRPMDGTGYRLPTDAEWEYACRANTVTPFTHGDRLNGREANVDGTSPYGGKIKGAFLQRPTTVGTYAPNAFGLFDMHGNVWEWCQDVYDANIYSSRRGTTVDPVVADNPTSPGIVNRVVRGGSWKNSPLQARSAFRHSFAPHDTQGSGIVGFRVVRPAGEAPVP